MIFLLPQAVCPPFLIQFAAAFLPDIISASGRESNTKSSRKKEAPEKERFLHE
jgi:hypothetical protein